MTDKHNTLTRRDFVQGAATLAAGAALFPPGASAAGTSRMAIRDYVAHDATGLAALVKRGEVSAAELLELAIARTEAVNGSITAVCLKHYDEARAALKSIDPERAAGRRAFPAEGPRRAARRAPSPATVRASSPTASPPTPAPWCSVTRPRA